MENGSRGALIYSLHRTRKPCPSARPYQRQSTTWRVSLMKPKAQGDNRWVRSRIPSYAEWGVQREIRSGAAWPELIPRRGVTRDGVSRFSFGRHCPAACAGALEPIADGMPDLPRHEPG